LHKSHGGRNRDEPLGGNFDRVYGVNGIHGFSSR
jgi:hypothetical protein